MSTSSYFVHTVDPQVQTVEEHSRMYECATCRHYFELSLAPFKKPLLYDLSWALLQTNLVRYEDQIELLMNLFGSK